MLWSPILYTFFHVSPYVYSRGQGQTIQWGQNFDDDRNAFSLCPYVASFKMISSKSDFYTFLMILYMYIDPGQGQKSPCGQTFDVNRKPYHFDHLLQVSKKSLWILILYTFFNVFPRVYSLGAGADNHLWTKSWCRQKSLITLPICCKFQKNIFKVWFYT